MWHRQYLSNCVRRLQSRHVAFHTVERNLSLSHASSKFHNDEDVPQRIHHSMRSMQPVRRHPIAPLVRRQTTTANTDTLSKSSVNLNRGSDRLSKAVKVEAPIPNASEMITSEGISSATRKMFSEVLEEHGGQAPSAAYAQLVARDVMTQDDRQTAALALLDTVFHHVSTMDPPAASKDAGDKGQAAGGGFLGNLMNGDVSLPRLEHDYGAQRWRLTWRAKGWKSTGNQVVTEVTTADKHQQGLYLYGGVGTGKTMLMDVFFFTLPVHKKRRVHFHSFMLDIHLRVHRRRHKFGNEMDPLPAIAKTLLSESWVLCFDEFQVTDVADAMIMARLFAEYFKLGGIMLATSNRAPDGLYEHGLQRSQFLPFIKTLKDQCIVHDMESATDYRLTGHHKDDVFMFPLNDDTRARAENLFRLLSKGETVAPMTLRTQGRMVRVPEAAERTKVARFAFEDLCKVAMGAGDYIAIARYFHTVLVTDIPMLDTGSKLNETRRFITLIDTLYEHHVKVVCTAEGPPHRLLDKTQHAEQEIDLLGTAAAVQDNKDEAFAFERTVSRLREMQSEEYLQHAHKDEDSAL